MVNSILALRPLSGEHPLQPDEAKALKAYLRSRKHDSPVLFLSNRAPATSRGAQERDAGSGHVDSLEGDEHKEGEASPRRSSNSRTRIKPPSEVTREP